MQSYKLFLNYFVLIQHFFNSRAYYEVHKNEKRPPFSKSLFFTLSTPAGVRTLDTLIKSQVLYQLSYGCIRFSFAGAKVQTFHEPTKLFTNFF